jgi:hypothetical protein
LRTARSSPKECNPHSKQDNGRRTARDGDDGLWVIGIQRVAADQVLGVVRDAVPIGIPTTAVVSRPI